MSETAAADWELEEEASSAGLSANARPRRRRHLARHRLFRKCDRWRIVSRGRRPAAQCTDTTQKGIGVRNGSNMSEVRHGNMPLA